LKHCDMKNTDYIRECLLALSDFEYRDFQAKLMPTVNKEKIIGVRIPLLRSFANKIALKNITTDFLCELPHKYYEEDNLHAFLIEKVQDFETCIIALDEFLPYVDNWATCDTMNPKILGKNTQKLLPHIYRWLSSSHPYTVRYGIGMLMRYYLGDNFKNEYAEAIASLKSDEYYVNMMSAWYFATALAKQYDSILPYIESKKLSAWVHNKTIQKAVESYRIPATKKEYLKSLRIR